MNDKDYMERLGKVLCNIRHELGAIRFYTLQDINAKDWVRILQKSGLTDDLETFMDGDVHDKIKQENKTG